MTRRLKIAHLFQSAGIQFSQPQAAQLHIYHTIHGLQQAGHQVDLLALQKRRVLSTDDLAVFTRPAANGHFGKLGVTGSEAFMAAESGIRRVQRTLKLPYLALFDSFRLYDGTVKNNHDYDLFHERFNLMAVGGAKASRKTGIPFVLEVNADLIAQREIKGKPEKGLRLAYARWATNYCFDTAAKIICISDGLREHLHKNWDVPLQKLMVLPCAADIPKFAVKFDTIAIRQEFGLTDEPIAMWVGGFFDWHDLPLLMQSFTQVAAEMPASKLILVGDGDNRYKIAEMVANLGLVDNVIFTGAVAHERVPALLSIADITVSPATGIKEDRGGTGTPLKLFEYMAAGKPIVATKMKNSAAVITNAENGYLIEPGDVTGFAQAIGRLLADTALCQRLGENGQKQARQHHSWENYTNQLVDIYESVLSNAS